MKLALIEFVAELLLRARSQFLDLQHPNFISAGLTGRDDVTLDFRFHFFFAHPGFIAHVGDRLIARPMLGVNSGIDDQTHRAEKFVPQTAEVAERVLFVPANLFRKPFAVKGPTFRVSSERNDFAKLRHAFEFLRN